MVHEGVRTLGIGAEIAALVAGGEAFDFLDAPIMRLGGRDAPLPYNPVLEKAAVRHGGRHCRQRGARVAHPLGVVDEAREPAHGANASERAGRRIRAPRPDRRATHRGRAASPP